MNLQIRALAATATSVGLLWLSACGGSGGGSPNTYTIAGRVSGLRGSGLVLQDNGGNSLSVNADGGFAFTTPTPGPYNVTVLTQPSSPAQNCVVTNGSGSASANVTDVMVGCVGLWTWAAGSDLDNQFGNSGTMGVPSVNNIPGARESATGCSDAGGDFWLYGGTGYNSYGVYGGLGDLWRYSAGEWTWLSGSQQVDQLGTYGTLGVPSPNNDPGYRNSAVCWIDSAGNFWLFGGGGNGSSSSSGWLNDLWKYSAGEWAWMGGANVIDQTGVYGSLGVPSPSNVPGARAEAVSWVDSGGNFWLFGGTGFDSNRADDYGWLNDLWEYTAGGWVWMGGSTGHYQSGTYGTQGVAAPGNFPGARYGAVAWTDRAGDFWLFGGSGYASGTSSGFLNDLWKYSGGQWTWISGSNIADQQGVYGAQGVAAPSNVPGPRQFATGWTDNSGNLWLFGGTDLGGNFNDLWRYSAGQWTWMSGHQGSEQNSQPGIYGIQNTSAPSNIPGARAQAVAWTDATGNLWLFSGNGYDSTGATGFLNDLWEYQP